MFQAASIALGLSILLIAVFVTCAIGNSVGAGIAIHRRRGFSMVPLIGGLAGAVGFAIGPWTLLHSWWWLPLILDLSFPMGILAVFKLLADSRRHKRTLCDDERK